MKKESINPRLDVFKSKLVKGASFSPHYELPILANSDYKPERALPFEKASTASNHAQGVHFYTHDYHFECVWNNPDRYLPLFQRFQGIISPDFSLYREMPLAMQIWNTYRGRALAFWLQSQGIKVVPNVRWGDERSYEFVFEGLTPGGTVAVSTNGCIQSKLERRYFAQGLAEMVKILRPQTIINYSQTPDDIFNQYREKGIEVISIPHYAQIVRKAVP